MISMRSSSLSLEWRNDKIVGGVAQVSPVILECHLIDATAELCICIVLGRCLKIVRNGFELGIA